MTDADFTHGRAEFYIGDCLEWLRERDRNSIHGVVTDPPYGLIEYSAKEMAKLRTGRGGVWRVPPALGGHKRSPLPRFTVLSDREVEALYNFFYTWAGLLFPVITPGAHVMVASNPLLSHMVARALHDAGLERRGEIIRLVQTLRGGDRPKNAHDEFPGVTVMPRSLFEPWVLFRKPLEGRVQDNLRKWGTGGLRRPSPERPFGDVIRSAPTRPEERALAPHPSLKPQALLRELVRAVLPLGEGVVLDTFAGSGSTCAAAEVVGYRSIGVDSDPSTLALAQRAIPALAAYQRGEPDSETARVA
ncbi:MAG TPA: DNA methyltransferase [Gaiellaceae bacterium]